MSYVDEIKWLFEVEDGHEIGRNPRDMSVEELRQYLDQFDASTTPMRAIRKKCMDCCGENYAEVRKCTAVACALWPFRTNKNPYFGKGFADKVEIGKVDDA